MSPARDGRKPGLPAQRSPMSTSRLAAQAFASAHSAPHSRPRLRLPQPPPPPPPLQPPLPAAWASRCQHAARLQARGLGVRQDEGLSPLAGPGEAAREMGQEGGGGWGSSGSGPGGPVRRELGGGPSLGHPRAGGLGGPRTWGTCSPGLWGGPGLRGLHRGGPRTEGCGI